MYNNFNKITTVVLLFCALSCSNTDTSATEAQQLAEIPAKAAKNTQLLPKMIDQSTHNIYSWSKEYQAENALINRIPPPNGYKRQPTETGDYTDWLRHLPLKTAGSKVMLYNGGEKSTQQVHAAVIDIDTGKRDLQQCADAVMRLKAEYHYSKKEFDQIHFNYTSGDRVAFDDWRKGRKPVVSGNKVSFTAKTSNSDNSYGNFKKYMNAIFNYAGTASLSKELSRVEIEDMEVGDVFIQGGFPGHAVLVVDMAVQPETGKKVFLLAQSYMPAQDMHILKNFNDSALSPWYDLGFGSDLRTPEWGFTSGDLKR